MPDMEHRWRHRFPVAAPWRRIAAAVALLLLAWAAGCDATDPPPLSGLEGAPPDSVTARCLDRAITLSSCLHLYPWAMQLRDANLDLVAELQPALVGRAAVVWGWEHLALRSLGGMRYRVRDIHDRAPDAVVQGGIFEFVSRDVERLQVPRRVQLAYGLEPEERHYDLEAMLPAGAEPRWWEGWPVDAVTPDITRLETRLWYLHLAMVYIDEGLEAIHLGAIESVAAHDPDRRWTADLIGRIRAYAADHARRGWVILDAHTHGVAQGRRLLLDFHSFPLRPRETGDDGAEDVHLAAGFLDAIYGRSLGGVTPSGRVVRRQRFLVELDNGYAGATPGGCDLPECVWGSDEITWFARQPDARRDHWLAYFHAEVPRLDPAGRFQMPGVRPVQAQLAPGCDHYLAHDPGAAPCGAGQAEAIANLWGMPQD